MNASDIIFYTTPQGEVRIEVFFEDETFWLTQKKLAELFDVEVNTINYHLKEVYKSAELQEVATIRRIRIVQLEGGREVAREVEHYNLDAIIAVGYRVNSTRATKFRIWATNTLKEYIIKGFVLDDARLKQGKRFGQDYFEELLERIREIRASERRFYEKITDIYKECSRDYDANDEVTRLFYKTVQNKLHWAIHRHTAAELIAERAKAELPHMGLTTWKNAPDGKVLKSDVTVAKNYLNAEEIAELDRIVGMYLDYAENQAKRGITMYMKDWAGKLDAFLQFNDYNVLKDAGRVSHDVAVQLAEGEYEKFRVRQDRDYISDFDKEVRRLTGGRPSDLAVSEPKTKKNRKR
ncbi:MAG: virulence RhuM family protein [Flavobacteriales bacterium]|nr:virulence RhuM family protein [Flavobacteriales bacterium]